MIVLYVVCVIILPIWQNYLSSKNWLVLPSRISPASFFFLSPGSSVFTNANNRFRQLAGYLNWHLSWSRQKSSLVLLPWIRMRPPQLSSCRVTVLLDWARVVSYLVYTSTWIGTIWALPKSTPVPLNKHNAKGAPPLRQHNVKGSSYSLSKIYKGSRRSSNLKLERSKRHNLRFFFCYNEKSVFSGQNSFQSYLGPGKVHLVQFWFKLFNIKANWCRWVLIFQKKKKKKSIQSATKKKFMVQQRSRTRCGKQHLR